MVKISRNLEIVLGQRQAAREQERFWEKTHKLFLVFFSQLYIFRMIYLEDGSGHAVFSQCATHCSFPRWWHQAFYNFFTFGCLFIFPLLIMLVCNAKIIFTLTRVLQQNPRSTYSLDVHNNCRHSIFLSFYRVFVDFPSSIPIPHISPSPHIHSLLLQLPPKAKPKF